MYTLMYSVCYKICVCIFAQPTYTPSPPHSDLEEEQSEVEEEEEEEDDPLAQWKSMYCSSYFIWMFPYI